MTLDFSGEHERLSFPREKIVFRNHAAENLPATINQTDLLREKGERRWHCYGGKREFRRGWRWLWVLLAAVLAVGIFGGTLAYRAYREWMDEIIWDSSQWAEGFSYWRTLHTTDGEDIGPALEALEELQADGPVQLKSREEAAAFDERFGAYGLEPVGEYDFSESWLWVTGCVMPVGVWLEDEVEGLRAVLVTPPRGETRGGAEVYRGAELVNGLVVCVTPKVELTVQD